MGPRSWRPRRSWSTPAVGGEHPHHGDALPGDRLRPHVKAHKCTALATRQAAAGLGFTCATVREMEGMARAGLDDDLLLANEVADASRLGVLARAGARVTVAVDSDATIHAARGPACPRC